MPRRFLSRKSRGYFALRREALSVRPERAERAARNLRVPGPPRGRTGVRRRFGSGKDFGAQLTPPKVWQSRECGPLSGPPRVEEYPAKTAAAALPQPGQPVTPPVPCLVTDRIGSCCAHRQRVGGRGLWRCRAALGCSAAAEGVCCLAVHRWAAERLFEEETGRGGAHVGATAAGRMSILRRPLKGGKALPMQGRKKASEGDPSAQSDSGAWHRRGTGGPGRQGASAMDPCGSGPLGTGGRRSGGTPPRVQTTGGIAAAQGLAIRFRGTCRMGPRVLWGS